MISENDLFCRFCGSQNLLFHTKFEDRSHSAVDVFQCQECWCDIPYHKIEGKAEELSAQTRYHENLWSAVSNGRFEAELVDLKQVARMLHKQLDLDLTDGYLVEVGCGRGGLLRAFLDLGYRAIGCEPSETLINLAKTHYNISENEIYCMDSENLLSSVVDNQGIRVSVFLAWHVIEHIQGSLDLLHEMKKRLQPEGYIVIQVPLMISDYIFREHYFLFSHKTIQFISNSLKMNVSFLDYDYQNMYMTLVLKNSREYSESSYKKFENSDNVSTLAKLLLLRDKAFNDVKEALRKETKFAADLRQLISERDASIEDQASLIEERWKSMKEMDEMIASRDRVISDQARLIDDRWVSMKQMDAMISERDRTIKAQQTLIDQRLNAMDEMETMISDRDEVIIQLTEQLDAMKAKFI